MSGRRSINKCAWAATLILLFSASAMSMDAAEFFSPPFTDPLLTLPETIDRGAILPGDSSSLPCPVQKDFNSTLTLIDAVDLALCQNPQIRSAWASIKVQSAAVGEARAAYLPTLSGTVSRLNDRTRYPGSVIPGSKINSQTAYATLSWRVLDFGGREANREAANWGLAAALDSHDAALQKTLSDVVQAYFDAQTARATWQAKSLNEDIARNTLETAKRREEKGASARSDTLQATTALARANLERSRAQGAWQKALSVLVYTLGVPTQTKLILADDLETSEVPSAKNLDGWLEEIRNQHPAILAARAQLEVARYRIKAAQSDGLPTLDFTGNYYENGRPGQGLTATRTQERTLGIALTLPIFDGFSRTYKIRGAEAQVELRKAELENTEHQILMEVVKAHADTGSALDNLQASEALLAAAQESLSVSQRKYEKGAADILEILSTQAALSDAREQRIRCQAEWRSARLRLLANAGLMGRAEIKW
jgi:outer membrane protein